MIIVLFGQPHSGKTTLANSITADYYIDGDHLRTMFKNKDYSNQKVLVSKNIRFKACFKNEMLCR